MNRGALKNRLADKTCRTCNFSVSNNFCCNYEVVKKLGYTPNNRGDRFARIPKEKTCGMWSPDTSTTATLKER
jgi:hypothetical protein